MRSTGDAIAAAVRGKQCLVTAAGQGIGRACAELLHQCGAQVLATDIDIEKLSGWEGANSGIQVACMDVTSPSIVRKVASNGKWDVVVNCAGYVHDGTLLECDPEDWTRSLQLNVSSQFSVCRTVLPGMIERRAGSIINIASIASSIKGVRRRCAYGVTKAAVIGLTKSIAADFVEFGVRCNAVCPGTIDTPSLRERLQRMPEGYEIARQQFVGRQPMGRLGTAEEVAALVLYLASDVSAFTTGAIHVIDGGWVG